MLESKFERELTHRLAREFPDCMVLKNDAKRLQGIPDLLVLFRNKWATLETKRGSTAASQPNQEYYVKLMNDMSYSAFVSPENVEDVIHALHKTFGTRR